VLARWLIERGYDAYVEDTFRDSVDFNERELLQEIAPGNDEHARQVRERLKYWTMEMCKSQSYKFDFVITVPLSLSLSLSFSLYLRRPPAY